MARKFEELELVFKTKYPSAGQILPTPEEEATEDLTAEEIEEPIDESTEEEVEEPTEESIDESIDEAIEEPLEESIDEATEEPVGESAEEPTEEVAKESVDEDEGEKEKVKVGVSNIIFYAVLALLVAGAILITTNMRELQCYNILTDSMQSVYPRGSLVVVQEMDGKELLASDDIAFTSQEGEIIVHRIFQRKEIEETGGEGFETEGVDAQHPDSEIVAEEAVIGKVIMSIPILGMVSDWISNNMEIVLAVFTALAIIISGIKFWRGKHARKVAMGICVIGLFGSVSGDNVLANPQEVQQVAQQESETLTPTSEGADINPGPANEAKVDYSWGEYKPGQVVQVDISRGVMTLILGMTSAKIIVAVTGLMGKKQKQKQ